MTTKDFRKRLLGAGSALRVLALVSAGAAASGIIAVPAAAQDFTSGSIAGTVTDESGNAVSGATVTLTSKAQGFTRNVTTTSSGGFRFVGLPAGGYDIVVDAAGQDTFTATDVRVLPSQTADLNIGLTTTGNEIVVTAATIVSDFSGTTTGLNVDIDDMVKTVPINRDLTSVVLLAPGTSAGDSAFGNLASIAGASVAENAYYVNGLNVTNFTTYVGGADVPFDFLRTVDVKSGGYPAEFGRATGGIVSQTTKSGTNEFTAAAHLYWEPNFLAADGKELLTCNGPDDCIARTNRSEDRRERRSLVLEAGGPIIKDRLFIYGLVEFRKNKDLTINRLTGLATEQAVDDPRWGVKLDAYPVDGHHLEFTIFDSETNEIETLYNYSEPNNTPTVGVGVSQRYDNSDGLSYVAKYTGNLTDWLTVSGAYGVMQDRFDTPAISGDASRPNFQNGCSPIYPECANGVDGVPFGGLFNGQNSTLTDDPYRIEREFFRGDVDLYFSLFGDHHIRAGFDVEKNDLVQASVRPGGNYLFEQGFLSEAAILAGEGGGGAALILRSPLAGADTTNGVPIPLHVEVNYYNNSGSFGAKNKAFYIQDEWDVTDRLTLNLGVRRDDFSVNRGDGVNMVTLDENYAPRLGFSYDVFEDFSGTFYGNYGVYYLPFASNTSFRMTGFEYYIRERYEYLGVDGSGLPILGDQITNHPSYQAACPIGLTPTSSGFNCNVTADGTPGATDTLISHNLKATKVDEFIIGYRHGFNDVPVLGELNVGINYTRRRLKLNAEDSAIDAAVLAYCDAEGIAGCDDTWTGFHQYVVMNPGQELTVALDGLDGRVVTFTPDQLGYAPATRKYDAVELTFERPFDGSWSLGGSYTWSKSRGNSEGFVQSDFGQDDAGITQDFDQPGFLDGAYGYLPSDRRHRIKAWGAVSITEGLIVGTNVSIASPRSLSCLGFHPTDPFANAYGAASRYCNGELSPRGTAQKSDWIYNFDLKMAYEMKIPTGQLVRIRADVFNLLNAQGVQERNETGELDLGVANPNYGLATFYQSPRRVRLGLDIEF